MSQAVEHTHPDHEHSAYDKTILGFWIYLMTDFVLFGVLFATYEVLRHSTFGGPGACELFKPAYNLIETLVLLVSSFTIALGCAFAHRNKKNLTVIFYIITFLLGLFFFLMQLHEYAHLIQMGWSWKKSAYLSAYFTLLGTHSMHMFFALIWIIVFTVPLMIQGFNEVNIKRLTCLRMFWQFLNIVWIFIFSIVYLMGACIK